MYATPSSITFSRANVVQWSKRACRGRRLNPRLCIYSVGMCQMALKFDTEFYIALIWTISLYPILCVVFRAFAYVELTAVFSIRDLNLKIERRISAIRRKINMAVLRLRRANQKTVCKYVIDLSTILKKKPG